MSSGGDLPKVYLPVDMDVSKNGGTPKSSILIGFALINHAVWGTPIFGNTHMDVALFQGLWMWPYGVPVSQSRLQIAELRSP